MEIKEVLDLIEIVKEENEPLQKNVTHSLNKIKNILNEEIDLSLKKDKCINELQEIDDDSSLDQNVRTQLWDIISVLEQL